MFYPRSHGGAAFLLHFKFGLVGSTLRVAPLGEMEGPFGKALIRL